MKKTILFFLFFFSIFLVSSPIVVAQKHYHAKHTTPKVHSGKKKVQSKNDSLVSRNGTPVSKDSISEPGLADSKEWIIKKITDFKPTVYFVKGKEKSQNCEWKVSKVSFVKDKLVMILQPGETESCVKNVTATLSVEFSALDSKKTNGVEAGRKVYLFAKANMTAFSTLFEPSLAAKTFNTKINFIYFSFDNLSSLYETSLCTRLAKAFNRVITLKTKENQQKKEAF